MGLWSDTLWFALDALAAPTLVIWKHAGLLDLIWTGNVCATSYRVEHTYSLSIPFTELATTGGISLTLTDPAPTGFYRVIAIE